MRPLRIRKNERSIRAITPVIGTILMIALTVAVGFATWAWARSAAVSNESIFGNAVSCNIAYLKENFAIVNANYSSTGNSVSLWIYNYGNTTVYIKQLLISNSTWTSPPFTGSSQVQTCNGKVSYYAQLSPDKVTVVTLSTSTPFTKGSTYQFSALSVYSNTNNYLQTR